MYYNLDYSTNHFASNSGNQNILKFTLQRLRLRDIYVLTSFQLAKIFYGRR
jgi:hypothetical protein